MAVLALYALFLVMGDMVENAPAGAQAASCGRSPCPTWPTPPAGC